MTQLKAYFISLGGDLESMLSESKSVFDRIILQNFNTHLSLTLLSNPELISKYSYYADFIRAFLLSKGLSHDLLDRPLLSLTFTDDEYQSAEHRIETKSSLVIKD